MNVVVSPRMLFVYLYGTCLGDMVADNCLCECRTEEGGVEEGGDGVG